MRFLLVIKNILLHTKQGEIKRGVIKAHDKSKIYIGVVSSSVRVLCVLGESFYPYSF